MSLSYVDPCEVVKQALNDNWVSTNHFGPKPTIKIIYGQKKISQAVKPTLSVYERRENVIEDYATRQRYDQDVNTIVDIRARKRRTMKTIKKEAERVLDLVAYTIGDVVMGTGLDNCYTHIWKVNSEDLSNRAESFHRVVIEYKLESIGVVRATV